VSASAALKWHDKYSELYPDADNLEVLIAQRARLYPEFLSVYDGQLTVSFEGDDEYPKAIIWQTVTIDSGGEREQTPDHPVDPLPVLCSDSLSPEPDALEMVAAKLGHATLGDSVAAFKV
jgi:hypothetical protein